MPATAAQFDPLLTVEETARILGVSPGTCYRLTYAGELRPVRLGSGPKPRIRFEADELRRFVREHTEPAHGR